MHRSDGGDQPRPMTDVSSPEFSLPGRFGIAAHVDDAGLRLVLTPQPEVLAHGVVRASVLAYAVDAVAGISIDESPDVWTLTTDLSLRMRPVPAPEALEATSTVVRRGRRSVTSTFEVADGNGATVAWGAIGFATVPRRPPIPRSRTSPQPSPRRCSRGGPRCRSRCAKRRGSRCSTPRPASSRSP